MMLAAIVASALLAGLSPGTGVDERELDARLSSESVRNLRADHLRERSPLHTVHDVLRDATHGSLGTSALYRIKISELLQARAALSAQYLVGGLLSAWFFAAALIFTEQSISARITFFPRVVALVLLMVPSAVLASALGLLTAGAPYFCVAAVVFARVYTVASEIARKGAASRHSFYALAAGMRLRQRFFLQRASRSRSRIAGFARSFRQHCNRRTDRCRGGLRQARSRPARH